MPHTTVLARRSVELDTESNVVESVSVPYVRMADRWDLIQDLLGGTLRMRDAGEKWLPKEPREEQNAYLARLNRSVLTNKLNKSVKRIVAKPFAQPVSILPEEVRIPRPLDMIEEETDNSGNNLTQFTKLVFEDAVKWGLTHILVDSPRLAEGLTLAQEIERGIHPYFVHISAPNLIAWKFRKNERGEEELTQIRYRSSRVEETQEGGFGEIERELISVWNAPPAEQEARPGDEEYVPGTFQIWRKELSEKRFSATSQHQQAESWELIEEGFHTYPGVPLVTYYTNRVGFMEAEPPMEDLAWLNLAHWQSSSDQRNLLRFSRVGMWFAAGFSEEEISTGFSIGPNNIIASTNPDAKLAVVEHSGSAIATGEQDLRNLETEMDVMGLRPFIEQSSQETATGRAINEAGTTSEIQSWIRGLEKSLKIAYKVAGRWLNPSRPVELPEEFRVNIFNEFSVSIRHSDDLRVLLESCKSGKLPVEDYWSELKRRGVLSESFDMEEAAERLLETARAMAQLFQGQESEEQEDEEDQDNEAA